MSSSSMSAASAMWAPSHLPFRAGWAGLPEGVVPVRPTTVATTDATNAAAHINREKRIDLWFIEDFSRVRAIDTRCRGKALWLFSATGLVADALGVGGPDSSLM